MGDALTPYGELAAVLDVLPILLREARQARGLSMRDVADQLGVSVSTVWRVEHGKGYGVDYAAALLRWLDTAPPARDQPQESS